MNRALLIPIVVALLPGGAAGPQARAAEPGDDVDGTLLLAAWHGSFLTRGLDGSLCLVRGPDGSLRAEVAAGAEAVLDDLLDRRGEGWTVVLAAGGDGTINAWDREWSRLDAAAAAGLRVVAESLLASAAGCGSGGPRRQRAPATERHLLPGAGEGGLRAELVRRGRGRGGAAETLIVTRATTPGGEPILLVRSSRRPGVLRCDGLRRRSARFPAAETFVPLWPLRDLLELEPEIPGTCGPAGGLTPPTVRTPTRRGEPG